MAVLDEVDDGGEFATRPAVSPDAEDCGDFVAGEPPGTDWRIAVEQFIVEWENAVEVKNAGGLDLGDGVEARKAVPGALLTARLRDQDQCPVVEAFPDRIRAQPIGGGLQRGNVIHREKAVSTLRKPIWARLTSCSMERCGHQGDAWSGTAGTRRPA